MDDQEWDQLIQSINDQEVIDQEIFSDDDTSDPSDEISYLLKPQAI